MLIAKIIARASEMMFNNKSLRFGQALFNAYSELEPTKANLLSGTENDCFYDDTKVANFFKEITK